MESAALVAPLTHHPFVSKSQAPGGWNLLQQVAPLTHLAPVTHHRTVVGTCHWWVSGRRPNSLEYQICTAPEPFDTLVTGLVGATQLSCAKTDKANQIAVSREQGLRVFCQTSGFDNERSNTALFLTSSDRSAMPGAVSSCYGPRNGSRPNAF